MIILYTYNNQYIYNLLRMYKINIYNITYIFIYEIKRKIVINIKWICMVIKGKHTHTHKNLKM